MVLAECLRRATRGHTVPPMSMRVLRVNVSKVGKAEGTWGELPSVVLDLTHHVCAKMHIVSRMRPGCEIYE